MNNVKQMFIFLKIIKMRLIQTNVFDNIELKERVIIMKKALINLGGIIIFYSVIVFGVIILNVRFSHLNNKDLSNISLLKEIIN